MFVNSKVAKPGTLPSLSAVTGATSDSENCGVLQEKTVPADSQPKQLLVV